MSHFHLQLHANLENITDLQLDYYRCKINIDLRCDNCGEPRLDNWLVKSDEAIHHRWGPTPDLNEHYIWWYNCPVCLSKASIIWFEEINHQYPLYTDKDDEQYKRIVILECRLIEVTKWFVGRDGWSCRSSASDTVFNDIDLSIGWADYDEKAQKPVSITDIRTRCELLHDQLEEKEPIKEPVDGSDIAADVWRQEYGNNVGITDLNNADDPNNNPPKAPIPLNILKHPPPQPKDELEEAKS